MLGEGDGHDCLRALFHTERPLRVFQTDRAGDEAESVAILLVDAFMSVKEV